MGPRGEIVVLAFPTEPLEFLACFQLRRGVCLLFLKSPMVDNDWRSVSNVDIDENVNLHGSTHMQATPASTPTLVCTDSCTDAHICHYVKLTSGK